MSLTREGGNGQFAVDRPVENMQVDFVALARGLSPRLALQGGVGGAVDGRVVGFHPAADMLETLDGFGWEGATVGWADVEQVIAAAADHIDQVVHQGPGRFPGSLGGIVGPGLTHSHAGFPGLKMLGGGIGFLVHGGQFQRAIGKFAHQLAHPTPHNRNSRQEADRPEETIPTRIDPRGRLVGARRDAGLGDELLGGDEVIIVAEAVVDQRVGAELVDQLVEALAGHTCHGWSARRTRALPPRHNP